MHKYRTKRELVDVTLVDYDGAAYHVHTPTEPDLLIVSMRLKCYKQLEEYGAADMLKEDFGNLLQSQPESGYDVTLHIHLNSLPMSPGITFYLNRNILYIL